MKVSIGLIISEIHLLNMKNVEDKLNKICNVKYYIVRDRREVAECYNAHLNEVDAFILSGKMLYKRLLKDVKSIDKPCYVIYDDEANIYKQILKIFINNPQIDSSRVYIDFINEVSNLDFDKVFPKEKMPYISSFTSEDPDINSDFVLNNHLKLWKEKKIDLSITRYGILVETLKEKGINHYFIVPSEKYVIDLFIKAINEIKLKKINNNKISIIYISFDNFKTLQIDNYEQDIKMLELFGETMKFMKDNNFDFSIHKTENVVEIFTTIEEITKVTKKFTECMLQQYLTSKLGKSISIGYGSGKNISQAKNNALQANRYAKEYGSGTSFFIGEDQGIVGPIFKSKDNKSPVKHNPEIDKISKRLNINIIYIQKIVDYCNRMGTNNVTSREIASYLDIALRSANRVLNKILDSGFAHASFIKINSSKGRPQKYYKLKFLDSKGNTLA